MAWRSNNGIAQTLSTIPSITTVQVNACGGLLVQLSDRVARRYKAPPLMFQSILLSDVSGSVAMARPGSGHIAEHTFPDRPKVPFGYVPS
jgi:hypothetical protein